MERNIPYYIRESWLCHPLTDTNNIKTLPFVSITEDNIWYCKLCATGAMRGNSTHRHFQGRRHKERFQAWKALRMERRIKVIWCDDIIPIKQRIEKLGLWRWRSHLKDLLLEHLTTPKNDDKRLTKTLSTLEKYEQRERVSLLELAVWKSHCLGYTITNDSSKDVIFDTMQDIEDYGALDTTFNPAEFRTVIRVTTGVNVIISLVKTFL